MGGVGSRNLCPHQSTGSEPSPSLWLVEVHRQQADNEHSGEYGHDGCQRGLVEAPGLPITSGRLGVGVIHAATCDHLSAKHSLQEADLNSAELILPQAWCGMAQLVECWAKKPGAILTQVRFPNAAMQFFSPRDNFQCRLSYDVHTALLQLGQFPLHV